jgi:hypothetical protein
MYGMSAVSVVSKELERTSFAYNTLLWKLFGIKSKNDIKFVQYYCGYLEFAHLHNYYRYCFLNKLFARGHLTNVLKIDEGDMKDLLQLSNMYKLLPTDSNFIVKRKIWNFVESQLFG